MQDLSQFSNIHIYPLDPQSPVYFWELIEALGLSKDIDYYENCINRQAEGELEIYLASVETHMVGYCILNWVPKYTYFRIHNIPEIQDLNVLRSYRRHGIGAALIQYCESRILEKNYKEAGIGVGLDSSFGPAQRLYVRLGYIPDGQGISYDRKQVTTGEFRPIDGNLCLMMSKKLTNDLK